MNENEFNKARQNAIKQMQQMNNRSTNKQPLPKQESKPKQKNDTSLLGGLGIPFLETLKTDSDLTLIIGILLLLLSEKADKRLLFALIYILL
ncbi:MAG: hypothetical protein IJD45_06630 [Clostridia bacterium]|nr:hypothetical protein [Clostridia bacterium]